MPKTPTVSSEEILHVLMNYREKLYNDSNSINIPSSSVWCDISKDLNFRMSSKYIYVYV